MIAIIIVAVIFTLLGHLSKSKIGFEDTVIYGLGLIFAYLIIEGKQSKY